MMSRRNLLAAAAIALASPVLSGADEVAAVKEIEEQLGGRIGMRLLDTGAGRGLAYRGGERFAMCSTFKAGLAAAVLSRVDRGRLSLDRELRIDPDAILSNSPVTGAQPRPLSLRVEELCSAAVEHSDNTAANLLVALLGGPASVTHFFQSLGDHMTHLDRLELDLNSNIPHDVRDTTTPTAMAASLRAILLTKTTLKEASRQRLLRWMLNEQNGRNRIRAGIPSDWRTANKPGTGGNGAVNDVAVLWPPHRPPLVLTVYTNTPTASLADSERAIAAVARFVAGTHSER